MCIRDRCRAVARRDGRADEWGGVEGGEGARAQHGRRASPDAGAGWRGCSLSERTGCVAPPLRSGGTA
eukprot:1772679-Prymnesium_polylepis.2